MVQKLKDLFNFLCLYDTEEQLGLNDLQKHQPTSSCFEDSNWLLRFIAHHFGI